MTSLEVAVPTPTWVVDEVVVVVVVFVFFWGGKEVRRKNERKKRSPWRRGKKKIKEKKERRRPEEKKAEMRDHRSSSVFEHLPCLFCPSLHPKLLYTSQCAFRVAWNRSKKVDSTAKARRESQQPRTENVRSPPIKPLQFLSFSLFIFHFSPCPSRLRRPRRP